MPRNKVDEDKDRTCSHGLHFCSHGYLSNFSGEKVVVLKVNPRDVVAIPADYNNTKGRACRYEVVGELSPAEVEKAMHNGLWGSTVITDYDDADRDFDEDHMEDLDNDYDEQRFDNSDFGDADGDLEPSEAQSQSYVAGYNDGYAKGRVSGSTTNDNVIVNAYVSNQDEYVAGFERGFKDGKGHKAKARLAPVVPTDNETFSNFDYPAGDIRSPDTDYERGYKDGYDDGHNGDESGLGLDVSQEYRDGYNEGFENGEKSRADVYGPGYGTHSEREEVDPSYGRFLARKPTEDNVSIDDDIENYGDTVGESQSPSYVSGYNEGYNEGHTKDSFSLYNEDDIVRCGIGTDGSQFAAGYVRGFKDGRGHKAKARFVGGPTTH
jgi:hypothetical protein